jgi:tetratricopeptide (TPR) repeat protein
MLGGSAYFAFKIYQHIQTLQDQPQEKQNDTNNERSVDAFSTFGVDELIENADKAREEEKLDKAIAIYREANIKEPQNAEVLFKMGYTLSMEKRYDEALEYLFESLNYDDKNPFAYKTISDIYKELEDEQKAQEYYQKAKELDEDI